jgi:tetratricopeptide (TPR) repeat protein
MRTQIAKLTTLTASAVLVLGLTACGPSEKERLAKEKQDRIAAAWTAVESAHAPLLAKRQELATLRAQAAARGAKPEVIAQAEEVKKQADEMSDAFSAALTNFLNASEIVDGTPLNAEQQKAQNYLVEEQLILAQDYMAEGDYEKAIDIYDSYLITDKSNTKMQAARDAAAKVRYMTKDRFGKVKEGMTQDEVLKLLGPVRKINVHEFTEQKRIGWFYRKEDGGNAGIYFKEATEGSGEWVVESMNFDAQPAAA